jgi:uncharacterized protein YutE (UPF0331/DUF86 family)
LLQSFYNGIENVLKQILVAREKRLPVGPSSHRDLLDLAVSESLISEAIGHRLDPYLGFRHFFGHAYAFQLDSDRIVPLVEQIGAVFADLRREVSVAVAH